jgi:hypothetical protein
MERRGLEPLSLGLSPAPGDEADRLGRAHLARLLANVPGQPVLETAYGRGAP